MHKHTILQYEIKCPFCNSPYDMFAADERSRCANCGKDLIDAIEHISAINADLLEALKAISNKGMGGRGLAAVIDEIRTIAREAIRKVEETK